MGSTQGIRAANQNVCKMAFSESILGTSYRVCLEMFSLQTLTNWYNLLWVLERSLLITKKFNRSFIFVSKFILCQSW